MLEVGTFLKRCRVDSGLNQTDLAFELNLTQSDISKIERNIKEPRTSIFKDWTIATHSMDLGIAFLYGTEILTSAPEILTTVVNTVGGFINIFGGWL